MKKAFSEYFPTMIGAPVKSLAQLVAFNNAHEKFAFAEGKVPHSRENTLAYHHLGFYGQDFLEKALKSNTTEAESHALLAKTQDMAVSRGIEHALAENNLDFLLTPAWSYMSIYSAWASKLFLQITPHI